jgi:hypothetical protein
VNRGRPNVFAAKSQTPMIASARHQGTVRTHASGPEPPMGALYPDDDTVVKRRTSPEAVCNGVGMFCREER